MPVTPPAPTRARGFTLVEVMVALTILTLVMLATVTGLRTLGNTQVAIERLTGRVDEMRSVSSFLRDTLNSAVTGSDTGGLTLGGGAGERTIFEVRPNALIWKAVILFGEGFGGSYVVRVAGEGGDLVLRWQEQNRFGEVGDWNKAPSRTLVSGLQEFTVAYRREPGGEWLSDWDKQGAPGWVRLRIRADDRYWPDLVMQVMR
ncbi:MAG: prepilin-type N-terminal cleavage/methylation domain-containing protein [Chromatocurvus sp.]